MNFSISDNFTPEQQATFFLCLLPAAGLAALGAILRRCLRDWHADAERSDQTIKDAQRATLIMLITIPAAFLFFWIGDIHSLFGVLPTIELRFDWTHSIAVLTGLTAIIICLGAYRDPWLLPILGATATACVLAYLLDFPSRAGVLWLVPVAFCFMPVPFLFFNLLPPDPVRLPSEWIRNRFLRGARSTPLADVLDIAAKQRPLSSDSPVVFGFQEVVMEAASGHFLLAGTSGSGKTIALRLMMQSILPRIIPGSRQRAIVFDVKREQISVLAGMGLSEEVQILNPFDARCAVWDLAHDFKTPSDALQLAKLFLPEDQREPDQFWTKTARGLLADVIRAHVLAFRDGTIPHWSLSDLIRSLQSKDDIEKALALSLVTKDALRNLHEDKIYHGVLATLDLVRREFEVLGALWDEPSEDPERLFSLNQWVQGSGILVLGPSVTAEAVINPLNRLIIDRVAQLLLDSPDVNPAPGVPKSRTWMFLDEFPRLGRMPRLEALMTNGRSKGFIAVLAIQDILDLRKLYSPEYAAVITGACWNKLFFEAPSPEAATWCVETIGSTEVEQIAFGVSKSVAVGGSGTTVTNSESKSPSEKTRPLFTKEEFLYLGRPGERTPIRDFPLWIMRLPHCVLRAVLETFYATSRFSPIQAIASVQGRVYRSKLSFTRAIEAMMPKLGEDFIPRPDIDQFLKRWTPTTIELQAPEASRPALPEQIQVTTTPINVKSALFNLFSRKQKPTTPS